MKVLLVSFRFDTHGGAVAAVRLLAESLRDRGHRVVVATTRRERGRETVEEEGIRVHRLRPANLYWVGDKEDQPLWKRALWQGIDLWNPAVHREMRRIVEKESPDLVHVHKLRGLSPAAWTGARAAGLSRIVQTCHDYELISPEGTLSGRVGAWAEREALALRPYQAARRRMSRAVCAVTAPSRRALDLFVERGFFPRALCRVVPNSHGLGRAELARQAASAPRAAAEGVSILFLGRLHPDKGAQTLCRAVEAAARARPGLRLVLAGTGPLEGALRRRYDGHPAIRFAGPVHGAAKERLLAECDLVAVPSQVPETFGIVVAEAYAYGKPVIASRIGALPELVEEELTGVLVPPNDEPQLIHVLERLAATPETLRRMRPRCLERAAFYTVETVVEAYLDVYAAVLSHGETYAG